MDRVCSRHGTAGVAHSDDRMRCKGSAISQWRERPTRRRRERLGEDGAAVDILPHELQVVDDRARHGGGRFRPDLGHAQLHGRVRIERDGRIERDSEHGRIGIIPGRPQRRLLAVHHEPRLQVARTVRRLRVPPPPFGAVHPSHAATQTPRAGRQRERRGGDDGGGAVERKLDSAPLICGIEEMRTGGHAARQHAHVRRGLPACRERPVLDGVRAAEVRARAEGDVRALEVAIGRTYHGLRLRLRDQPEAEIVEERVRVAGADVVVQHERVRPRLHAAHAEALMARGHLHVPHRRADRVRDAVAHERHLHLPARVVVEPARVRHASGRKEGQLVVARLRERDRVLDHQALLERHHDLPLERVVLISEIRLGRAVDYPAAPAGLAVRDVDEVEISGRTARNGPVVVRAQGSLPG